MSTSLEDFLRAHPLETDLRLVEWHSRGADCLSVALEGPAWWRAAVEDRAASTRFTIELAGVQAAEIRIGWRQAQIEDLAVLSEDPLLWAYGTHATIFGNSPLPDPGRFFVEYWDLVHTTLKAGQAANPALAFTPFAEWAARVSGERPYHLLAGPLPLMEACRPLLDAQGVKYALLAGAERSADYLRLVWIGESWVICSEAAIVLPERHA